MGCVSFAFCSLMRGVWVRGLSTDWLGLGLCRDGWAGSVPRRSAKQVRELDARCSASTATSTSGGVLRFACTFDTRYSILAKHHSCCQLSTSYCPIAHFALMYFQPFLVFLPSVRLLSSVFCLPPSVLCLPCQTSAARSYSHIAAQLGYYRYRSSMPSMDDSQQASPDYRMPY